MNKSITPKRLKLIIFFVIIALIFAPIFHFLNSIQYNVSSYFNYSFWNDLMDFGSHKKEFKLIAKQIYLFVDSHPDFFEEFDGRFSIVNEGLRLYKKEYDYPENVYIHAITEERWSYVAKDYHNAFPENVKQDEISMRIYPNYISFHEVLFYTKDGKYPKEKVDHLKESNESVLVIKHAKGWYEINT